MKRSEVFPSKYIRPEDLNGRAVIVTIERAPLELLKTPDGKQQNKIVLYFVGRQKALPVNVTNFDTISDICAEDDTERWAGHQIELYPTTTTMGGRVVDCIRVRAPAQGQDRQPKFVAEPVQSPPAAAGGHDDMDDEIPF
jgi:hypothetical protein